MKYLFFDHEVKPKKIIIKSTILKIDVEYNPYSKSKKNPNLDMFDLMELSSSYIFDEVKCEVESINSVYYKTTKTSKVGHELLGTINLKEYKLGGSLFGDTYIKRLIKYK